MDLEKLEKKLRSIHPGWYIVFALAIVSSSWILSAGVNQFTEKDAFVNIDARQFPNASQNFTVQRITFEELDTEFIPEKGSVNVAGTDKNETLVLGSGRYRMTVYTGFGKVYQSEVEVVNGVDFEVYSTGFLTDNGTARTASSNVPALKADISQNRSKVVLEEDNLVTFEVDPGPEKKSLLEKVKGYLPNL